MRVKCILLATVLALPVGLLAPVHAHAQERHAAAHFGLGVGAIVCTLFYGPAKTIYALLGTGIGGIAWLLTTGDRNQTARGIIQPAVRGDYVVTPKNLTLEEPLSFVGRDPLTEPYPYDR
jgi:hypothetical protein